MNWSEMCTQAIDYNIPQLPVPVLILDLGLPYIFGLKRKRIFFAQYFAFLRGLSNVIWKKNSMKSRAVFTKFRQNVTNEKLNHLEPTY